jgi:hypothetical protein
MNQDDMIRMAREAGIVLGDHTVVGSQENLLEAFAALVAAHEREACAKVCEEPGWNAANWCAKQIRARGETK